MRNSTYKEDNIPRETFEKEMNPKVFEYKGNHRLTVTGISTGTVYNFHFHGEKLEVNYYDSFAMMAERDLKVIL